jgi:hypothetical protein
VPTDFEDTLHRTLVQFLVSSNQKELAAAVLDGEVAITQNCYDGSLPDYFVDIPVSAYLLIASDEKLQQTLRRAFRAVIAGRFSGDDDKVTIDFRMKLIPVEEGWQKVVRDEIAKSKGSNQGLVTELVRSRDGRPVLKWNELRYASNSEVRIAQELERRKILFFPLAVAVRAETGQVYEDHREVDFLICHDGVWGILEVAYHPDRYEKDKEKDAWFKKAGVLCIEHYTSEKCYGQSKQVVDEFLAHLARFKK